MLDFNGDGKDDVLLAESNQLRVFSGTVLEAPGNWTPILLDTTDSGAITLASPRLLGDINGDGLEDFGYINNGAARVAAFVALPDNYATC